MENEWVAIAGFTDDVRCQVAVERLQTNGIEAVAVDKRDSFYKFGEIAAVEKACQLIVERLMLKAIFEIGNFLELNFELFLGG